MYWYDYLLAAYLLILIIWGAYVFGKHKGKSTNKRNCIELLLENQRQELRPNRKAILGEGEKVVWGRGSIGQA